MQEPLDSKIKLATSQEFKKKGDKYLAEGNYYKAKSEYKKALKDDPQNAAIYYNLGIIHYSIGDLESAKRNYTTAIQFNPNDQDNYARRAEIYVEEGKLNKAILDYNKAVELAPEDTDILLGRARTYYNQNNYDNAINDCETAIKLDPSAKEGYILLGTINAAQNHDEKAISNLNQALEIDPTDPNIFLSLGTIYLTQKNGITALEYFNKAIQSNLENEENPENEEHFVARGDAYSQLNRFSDAIADYDYALKLNPDNTIAYDQLKQIFDTLDELAVFKIIESLPLQQQGSLIKHCMNDKIGKYFSKKENPEEFEYFLSLRRHKLLQESALSDSKEKLRKFDKTYYDQRITKHVSSEKLWMLLIDSQDHKGGRLAYEKTDEPNTEIGYINGCETAAAFIFRTQNQEITPEYIAKIHHLACLNVNNMNTSTHFNLLTERFRGGRLPLPKDVVTLDGLKEMLVWYKEWESKLHINNKPASLENIDALYEEFQIKEHAYGEGECTNPAKIPFILESILTQYYQEQKLAQNNDEQILAIVNLARKIEVLHPFLDGNGRTVRFLMLKELLNNKVALTCMTYPSIIDGHSVKEIDVAVKEGIHYYKNSIKEKELTASLNFFKPEKTATKQTGVANTHNNIENSAPSKNK